MKILILAYDFPPLPSVAGFRPYSWYKFFPQVGIYPIVITRNWSENEETISNHHIYPKSKFERIETKNSLLIKLSHQPSLKTRILAKYGLENKTILRKSLTFWEELIKFRTLYFDDKSYIYFYTDEFLSKNKVDCILATGGPFILFRYAHKLSKKYKIPWFADYRDGWSTNHSRPDSFLWKVLNFYYKINEKEFTKSIKGFSSVSNKLVVDIEDVISKKGIIIPNGVDLELVNSIPEPKELNKQFTLVFTGTIYEGQRIEEFLSAYENFLNKHGSKDILVKFIGIEISLNKNVSKIIEFSNKFPKNLVIMSRMSQRDSIFEQKKASVLLNFIPGTQTEGIIGGKTYEYLAIKKPILVIPFKEEKNPPLFPDRNFQYFAYSTEQIESLLEKFHNSFEKGEELTTDITNHELYDISRRKQAIILAEYLKNVINDSHS